MNFLADILAATFRNATPLVYGTVGETYTERAGILNLGIEGTMYAGAFFGFAVAYQTGNPLLGLLAAILAGILAGAIMGLLTVTLGANQHVSGLGLTIGLIGLSEFVNRVLFTGDSLAKIEPMPLWDPLAGLGPIGAVANQYGLTYLAFLVVVPVAWWVLARTPAGALHPRRGREPRGRRRGRHQRLPHPLPGAHDRRRAHGRGRRLHHALDAGHLHPRHHRGAGLGVHRPCHLRSLAHLPGRPGALVFAAVYSLGLRLRITPGFEGVPNELMLALPYIVVIAALALSGRNVPYPGAYLKAYRRT